MTTSLTYQTAVDRHPRQVDFIMRQLRMSTTKHHNAEPKELDWSYVQKGKDILLCARIQRWRCNSRPLEELPDELCAELKSLFSV